MMRLYSVDELRSSPRTTALGEISGWIRDVIARPDRGLGRSGAICPFVPSALQLDTVWLAVEDVAQPDERAVAERMLAYRDAILALEPRTADAARYKTIVVMFPGVEPATAPRVIDGAQLALKPYFVERGLMLGEFHPASESPGIHNARFRPLRSPVPLIVVRYMVPADIHFLLREEDALDARLDFVKTYLRTFEPSLGVEARQLAHDACRDLTAAMAAERDPATGMASRRCLDRALREALGPLDLLGPLDPLGPLGPRDGEPDWLALLLVEVVGGDREMTELADVLSGRVLRDRWLIARFSQHKLAVLLPGLDDARARLAGEAVVTAAQVVAGRRAGEPLRVSIGGAAVRCRAFALGALVSAARHALQAATAERSTCLRMAAPGPGD